MELLVAARTRDGEASYGDVVRVEVEVEADVEYEYDFARGRSVPPLRSLR